MSELNNGELSPVNRLSVLERDLEKAQMALSKAQNIWERPPKGMTKAERAGTLREARINEKNMRLRIAELKVETLRQAVTTHLDPKQLVAYIQENRMGPKKDYVKRLDSPYELEMNRLMTGGMNLNDILGWASGQVAEDDKLRSEYQSRNLALEAEMKPASEAGGMEAVGELEKKQEELKFILHPIQVRAAQRDELSENLGIIQEINAARAMEQNHNPQPLM